VEFSQTLAKVRQERGMSQAMLGDLIGIHPSQIYRYEAGTSQPTLDVIRELSRALGVSADYLLWGGDDDSLIESRLRAAYNSANYLNPREQAVIADVIEAFIRSHGARYRYDRSDIRRMKQVNKQIRKAAKQEKEEKE
jgi:transcriptional regulator with XRE-family HTH domain